MRGYRAISRSASFLFAEGSDRVWWDSVWNNEIKVKASEGKHPKKFTKLENEMHKYVK